MKIFRVFQVFILAALLFLLSGCELLDNLRASLFSKIPVKDLKKQAESVIDETQKKIEDVKQQIKTTKESIEKKVQDVQNAAREVNEAVKQVNEAAGAIKKVTE